jgi:hypothetical protein
MKFGNWDVTEEGIDWAGKDLQRFSLKMGSLLETIEVEDSDETMYKWIVIATQEDWLTVDDLYDLNFAFVYAAAQTDVDFNYDIFDKSVAYQFEILEEEDDCDEPSLDDLSDEEITAEQQRKDASSERD